MEDESFWNLSTTAVWYWFIVVTISSVTFSLNWLITFFSDFWEKSNSSRIDSFIRVRLLEYLFVLFLYYIFCWNYNKKWSKFPIIHDNFIIFKILVKFAINHDNIAIWFLQKKCFNFWNFWPYLWPQRSLPTSFLYFFWLPLLDVRLELWGQLFLSGELFAPHSRPFWINQISSVDLRVLFVTIENLAWQGHKLKEISSQ